MNFFAFKYILLLLILGLSANAGRPVFHNIQRQQLIEQSSFIFLGWPSQEKAVKNCAKEMGRWWVHKVLKGDKSFEGKVIALAEHKYEIHNQMKSVSYAANIYKEGQINKAQGSSILFTESKNDGCFELSANGAQEIHTMEPEIAGLLSNDCSEALKGFVFHIDSLPTDCQQDSDCQLFYIHPNSCEKPFILNKKYETAKDFNLIPLQSAVRQNCSEEWKNQPACSPDVIPIRCYKNKCKDGISNLTPPPFKLSKGKIQSACAPHDALSKMIQLTDGNKEYPLVSLNWWGPKQPQFTPGTYSLSGKPAMENNFQVSFCFRKGSCQTPLDFKAKVIWEKTKAIIEFSFTLEGNEKIEGSAPLETLKLNDHVLCG